MIRFAKRIGFSGSLWVIISVVITPVISWLILDITAHIRGVDPLQLRWQSPDYYARLSDEMRENLKKI